MSDRLTVPADLQPVIRTALIDVINRTFKEFAFMYRTISCMDGLTFWTARIRSSFLSVMWDEKPESRFFQWEPARVCLVRLINDLEKVNTGTWHIPECLIPYYAVNPSAFIELPHASNKDNTKIAVFKDINGIFRDIQTVQKPAKWFKDFAKGSDVAASQFNNDFINSIVKPPVFWSLRELGRHDQAAWTWVYRNTHNTGSCMSGMRGECVKVYAHPDNDLDLIFTTVNNANPFEAGTIVNSRSIFDAGSNEFVRVYSDTHLAHHAFMAHIDGLGSTETRQLNAGIKLLKIEHPDRGGAYWMPYLDGIGSVEDQGDHFTTGGDIDASNTGGYCRLGSPCGYCGEPMNEDDARYTDSHGLVCEYCIEHEFFYCELSEEWYSNYSGDMVTVWKRGYGSRLYAITADRDQAEYCGYVRCDRGRYEWDYMPSDDLVEDVNGDMIHIDEALYCEVDGNYYHENDQDDMPKADKDEDEEGDTNEA